MKYTFTDPKAMSQYDNEKSGEQSGFFFVVVDGRIQSNPHCRDSVERRCQEFLAQSKPELLGKTLQLAFKKAGVTPEQLKAFWTPIFKKLGKESVVLFHTCNVPNTTVFNLRKFWMENQIRRSVFTMLVRASCNYPSFENAAENYSLLKNTLPALKYFLEGNTVPTFECEDYTHSFYYYFADKDKATIERRLTKPK